MKKDLFGDDNSQSANDFARMFENSLKGVGEKLKVGDRIRGEILSIGKEEVFVSTGTVNDGSLSRLDLPQENGVLQVKVGDTLDLFVTQVRGSEIRLSTKPTSKNLAEDLEDAFDMMMPVEGVVTEVVNGGFRVMVKGKPAFCPFSQIELRKTDSPEAHINRKYEFLISQFSGNGRNVVLSRRRLLEQEKEGAAAAFQEDVKPGDLVDGTVVRIEKFGAFVELEGGLEGLVHISEISWSRISDPNEVLSVGQPVKAKVLKIEDVDGRLRIGLSLKQAGEEPWLKNVSEMRIGQVLKGRITRRENYGLFVEILPGVVGLMPKSKALAVADFPFDKIKVGESVQVQISEIDFETRKMQLVPPADPDAEQWRDFQTGPSKGSSMGTLADQFNKALGKK